MPEVKMSDILAAIEDAGIDCSELVFDEDGEAYASSSSFSYVCIFLPLVPATVFFGVSHVKSIHPIREECIMAHRKGTIILKAIKDSQREAAEIKDFRKLDSGNIVLVFDGSEVVMPGNWRTSEDLAIGSVVAAYWDDGQFHLEF